MDTTMSTSYNQLLNSSAVQKYVKANPKNPNAYRDAIKALIMTTAKNDNPIEQAENSPINMGWGIG